MAVNTEAEIKRLNKQIAKMTEYAREIDKVACDYTEGGETFVTVPKELFEAFIDEFKLYA